MAGIKGVSLEDILEDHGLNPGTLSGLAYEVWNVWLDLNMFRQHTGFGPSPLHMADVLEYLKTLDVPKTCLRRCLRLIHIVEAEFLKSVAKQNKGKS